MKKTIKRIALLALSLVMTLSMFAGCGKADNEAEDQLAAIQAAGKIVVGVEGVYPPFNYHDQETNELIGYDVEVAKAIGEKLGVEVEFVEAAWDSLLAGVDSGRFDTVIAAVTATDARKEKYDFSDPYFYVLRQIIVRGDDDSIKGPEDLNGKKYAQSVTYAFAPWLEAQGATIVPTDISSDAFAQLLTDRVDFLSFDPVVVKSYLDEHPDADIKVAFTIPDSEDEVAIPVRKGETRLLDAINKALDEIIEDGTLLELSNKYFGNDYTKPTSES